MVEGPLNKFVPGSEKPWDGTDWNSSTPSMIRCASLCSAIGNINIVEFAGNFFRFIVVSRLSILLAIAEVCNAIYEVVVIAPTRSARYDNSRAR
jgi:hypothetical protein